MRKNFYSEGKQTSLHLFTMPINSRLYLFRIFFEEFTFKIKNYPNYSVFSNAYKQNQIEFHAVESNEAPKITLRKNN